MRKIAGLLGLSDGTSHLVARMGPAVCQRVRCGEANGDGVEI